ncbi:MAG: DUF4494 domain-containing protein [Prevotella sp.]|nr:DUF4494 domain-containing protein [Candidatus Prevotella equi]
MKTVNSTFFEVTVRSRKTLEDGTEKMVPEVYTVQAETFTEAEANVTEELSAYPDLEVRKEAFASYKEVFLPDDAEKFYKCKVAFISLDEKSGKEKQQSAVYLVGANSTEEAHKNLADVMGHGIGEYKVTSVSETKIVDVVWRK